MDEMAMLHHDVEHISAELMAAIDAMEQDNIIWDDHMHIMAKSMIHDYHKILAQSYNMRVDVSLIDIIELVIDAYAAGYAAGRNQYPQGVRDMLGRMCDDIWRASKVVD